MREAGSSHLFERYDAHKLAYAGDIGVTEAQQGEQRVGLRGRERERRGDG